MHTAIVTLMVGCSSPCLMARVWAPAPHPICAHKLQTRGTALRPCIVGTGVIVRQPTFLLRLPHPLCAPEAARLSRQAGQLLALCLPCRCSAATHALPPSSSSHSTVARSQRWSAASFSPHTPTTPGRQEKGEERRRGASSSLLLLLVGCLCCWPDLGLDLLVPLHTPPRWGEGDQHLACHGRQHLSTAVDRQPRES